MKMKMMVRSSAVALTALVSVAVFAGSAEAASSPSTSTSSAVAAAIQRADALGGTVLEYQPSTDTWQQVGTSSGSQTAAASGGLAGENALAGEISQASESALVAQPDASPATWGCMLYLAICANFGAQYSPVLNGPAKTIASSLEVLDGRELDDDVQSESDFQKASKVLDGADTEQSAKDLATNEAAAELGDGDAVVDEGSGVIDIVEDIALIAWV